MDEDKSFIDAALVSQGLKDGKEYCIADSKDDCCEPNGGAVAGLVIGVLVGVGAIGYTIYAFCCKKSGAPSMNK